MVRTGKSLIETLDYMDNVNVIVHNEKKTLLITMSKFIENNAELRNRKERHKKERMNGISDDYQKYHKVSAKAKNALNIIELGTGLLNTQKSIKKYLKLYKDAAFGLDFLSIH